MTDIALRITLPELKDLIAASERSWVMDRELKDQMRALLKRMEETSLQSVALVSKADYPIMFAIDRGYVSEELARRGIEPTDDNVRILSDEVERLIEEGRGQSIKAIIPVVIREYLDYEKLMPSTMGVMDKIRGIVNKLDRQIRQLRQVTENPERHSAKSVADAEESLYVAIESAKHWTDLYNAPLSEKGCLVDGIGAIPVGTHVSRAYAIYLKTYKTEV